MLLNPKYIVRYAEIARLLAQYGLDDIIAVFSLEKLVPRTARESMALRGRTRPERLRLLFEQLGPVFIKLGQVLSTRTDILPREYVRELEKLQDRVQPVPFEQVEAVIQEEFDRPVSALFEAFDPEPLAAASLGQVHAALARQGERLAVKVQRPGIRTIIESDVAALASLAAFMDEHSPLAGKYDFIGIVDQLERTLADELNYHLEARQTELLRMHLEAFSHIVVPSVVASLSTRRVLTVAHMDGVRLAEVAPEALESGQYAYLAEELFRAYLHQMCIHGVFHSDPHPGNVLLRADGRLILLDFGMVGRISRSLQYHLLRLLLDVSENRGDAVAQVCMTVGELQEGFERNAFVADICYLVGKYHNFPLREMEFGQVVVDLVRLCTRNHLRIPAELTLMGKTFLQLDGICRMLAPAFNPMAAVRASMYQILRQKIEQEASPQNLLSIALETRQLLSEVPRRLAAIVRIISENQIRLETRIDDMPAFLVTLDRIGSRIAVGLITAAIIVGSALMLNVPGEPRVLGYPIFAIVGFLVAGGFGIYLIINIWFSGRR
jgi:predicted unusual protein kinase regulating ubiquinone biosynthesis (AarF/ABC1/UbiB family)